MHNKKRTTIIFSLFISIMLSACGNKVDQKTGDQTNQTTLEPQTIAAEKKEPEEWEDNSKEVELFKKLSLSSAPDWTIGDLMNKKEHNINYWKYKEDEKSRYLMCNFNSNNVENSIVFYVDEFQNVNIAEYYTSGRKQDKETTEKFIKNLSIAEASATAENTPELTPEPPKKADKTATPEPARETKQYSKYPYPYVADGDVEYWLNTGKADGFYMPYEGSYGNGRGSDDPEECWVQIIDTDATSSFDFKIYGPNNNLIFKQHTATFEQGNSPYAIYRGENYTLIFECGFSNMDFTLSGFNEACKSGNVFSNFAAMGVR